MMAKACELYFWEGFEFKLDEIGFKIAAGNFEKNVTINHRSFDNSLTILMFQDFEIDPTFPTQKAETFFIIFHPGERFF